MSERLFDIDAQLRKDGLLNSDGTFWNPAEAIASKDPYEYHADVWRMYQAMLSKDGQIYAMSDLIMQAVLSLEETWDYEPCGGPEGEIAKYWEGLKTGEESVFSQLKEAMALAFYWGLSLTEIILEPDGGGWKPVKIVPIPAWWYKLDTDGLPHKVRADGYQAEKEPLPEDTYALFIYKGDNIRPYGRGIAELCYRPYLKKMLYDYNRLEVAERYVNPHLILHGKKVDVDAAAEGLINKLSKDIWGIYGDVETMRYEVIYPEGDKAMAAYEKGWAAEDRELAKIATGAVLVTEEAEHGTRAQSETMLVPYLARLFERAGAEEGILQYYINRITAMRFGDGSPSPDYAIKAEVPKDIKLQAEVISILTNAGYPIDPEVVEQVVGMPLERFKQPTEGE